MKVKQSLLKLISPEAPEDLRLKVARLEPPEALSHEDQVTALFVLGFDKSPAVSEAAKKNLLGCPVNTLLEALEKKLDPLVIKKIVSLHRENDAILIMAATNPGTDDETLKLVAETGPAEVVAVFMDEIDRVRQKPFILEYIKKNPGVPGHLMDEIERLASAPPEAGAAQKPESASTPAALKEEGKDIEEGNLYKAVKNMTMGQRIKLALCGNKSARELLVKDSNKMISLAVLKNPRITEDEVLKVSSSKGTPEDLLRQIGRNKEWIKSYSIKMGMITNPKTPLAISIKLVESLYDQDLQKVSKSKNVPNALANAARRKLEAKGKH